MAWAAQAAGRCPFILFPAGNNDDTVGYAVGRVSGIKADPGVADAELDSMYGV